MASVFEKWTRKSLDCCYPLLYCNSAKHTHKHRPNIKWQVSSDWLTIRRRIRWAKCCWGYMVRGHWVGGRGFKKGITLSELGCWYEFRCFSRISQLLEKSKSRYLFSWSYVWPATSHFMRVFMFSHYLLRHRYVLWIYRICFYCFRAGKLPQCSSRHILDLDFFDVLAMRSENYIWK